ncbi:hypothetical protein HBI22_195710 [Parastagonospora nodorum]|nr:hypothetical protein HBI28_172610 [Parastagonospora nodorum]KAH5621542.1 hypothetical protein HBI22_195710 [Parastagonospora nodorum]KAH6197827.1 hypothetical protein HBI53_167190 [Parastagonospora nodorum]
MRQFQMLFVLGATIALSVANVFTLSLGDIAQYSTSLATTPTLTGSRVLFTDAASPKGGLDVLLSEELRANVKKAFDSNCKSIDDQCIGSVKELLINPQTQLESRQVGQVAAAVAAVILLAAVLLPVLEKDRTQGIPVALHIPSAQLDLAVSVAATATIAVITASGTPFVTVTPRTPTASSVGADKPTETILSRPKDGHKPGDFAIHLSADLARRLSEMIDRSQQCPAGDSKPGMKVAQSNGVSMKALVDDTGAIKCAAEAIILNSFPGGPFSDLGSVTGEQPGWSSSDMIEVASSVSTFATSLVKSFGGNAAGATTLAFAAVYIAYVQIAGKQRLTTVNWIPGSELKGTLSAPKYDNSGTPSVESAIKEWCTRNDQTYLNSGSDERYGRFDIAQLGVPKRSSFWPRINLAESDKKGVVVKEQCISAFTDGLKECDSNSDKTHGFTAIVGTAKYSLELSGLVTEGNPPWQGSDKLSFPPSEFQNRYNGAIDNGDPWGIVCDIPNTYSGHKLYPDNLDKAINYFCVNGGPLKRHTQFYDNGKGKSSHLAMGAEPLNLKDSKRPYFDNRACDGYDWKMGADDCRYAFRKILGQCNNKDDRFNAGEWKYRCVNYKMWLVNV